ncbi:MAG TPA: tetratricopeptide repeat protein [Terriglobales bacterium]|nr:tetratricopeptide repeat protein [Terriglobales bacterium]
MQSYTRHQLKEDKFQEVTRGAIAQAQAHRHGLTVAGIAVLVGVIVLGGFGYWRNLQDEEASVGVGQAMNTFSAPIRSQDSVPDPSIVSFSTTAERDKQAEKQFQAIADKYAHTDSGKNALYMIGVVALDAGDYATAEAKFKKAADVGNKEIASLAKLGLASTYEATNRDQNAIDIYNELIKKPTASVSRERAQFALASVYEKKDPAQAKKIYDQLATDKSPTVAQIAKTRQSELKQ